MVDSETEASGMGPISRLRKQDCGVMGHELR